MGVLRERKKSIRVEEAHEINYGDYIFDSDVEEEIVEEKPVELPVAQLVRRKKSKPRLNDSYFQSIPERGTDGINIKRNMGARKWRRIENARLLLSFANADDLDDDYTDISTTITAFAKLFLDQENMKAWNDFIEKDEEEQRHFLEEIDLVKKQPIHNGNMVGGKTIKTPKELSKMNADEKRAYHPAYSAHACFQRLNSKFKSALSKKRRVPLNLIDKTEHRLREFFEDTPTGVWIETSMDSFQRLYVHAVANFLSLHSSTVTGDSSGKMIEVRNNRKYFIPPYDFLVPYLLEHFHKTPEYDDF
uniref:R3H domain-containing protein n=1 Tax=Acrobeloides nanus TaxID=290746 RepID=A0A914ELI2_9BILA